MGYFHTGSSLAPEFNLDPLFLLLKSRSCSAIMLAMEVRIGLVAVDGFYLTPVMPSRQITATKYTDTYYGGKQIIHSFY